VGEEMKSREMGKVGENLHVESVLFCMK
jgi:hypothetical protein